MTREVILGAILEEKIDAVEALKTTEHSQIWPGLRRGRWRRYDKTPRQVHWTDEPSLSEVMLVEEWCAKQGIEIELHLLTNGQPAIAEHQRGKSTKEIRALIEKASQPPPDYSCC